MNEKTVGENISGTAPPRSFILDASELEFKEELQFVREDVKQNKIRFKFPAGFNKLDLLEECRALLDIENFDVMFDIVMQMLANKDVEIFMLDEDGKEHIQELFHVTDKFMDLRGIEFIDQYPVVVTWLTEFIGASLLKKFPVPGKSQSASPKAPGKKKEKMRLKELLS